MIVYDITCENAHRFEGWFSSPEQFEAQAADGQISCPVCGSVTISRQPSAPYVSARSEAQPETRETAISGESMDALRGKFIDFVLSNTEDVGQRFPEEARRIHNREAAARSIRGQASKSEVEELREEGIEIFTIPGIPVPPDQVH
ncbi:MAG: DUF1178 family protein [Burkholderiales bacterium]